jgi:hypothetical protein
LSNMFCSTEGICLFASYSAENVPTAITPYIYWVFFFGSPLDDVIFR